MEWKAQQAGKLDADKKAASDKFSKELQDLQAKLGADMEQQKKTLANASVGPNRHRSA